MDRTILHDLCHRRVFCLSHHPVLELLMGCCMRGCDAVGRLFAENLKAYIICRTCARHVSRTLNLTILCICAGLSSGSNFAWTCTEHHCQRNAVVHGSSWRTVHMMHGNCSLRHKLAQHILDDCPVPFLPWKSSWDIESNMIHIP